MDTIHTNSTDEECMQDEVPKTSTELPQSQQPINSTLAVVWGVMANTNDCSPHDNLQNTDEPTEVSKLPEEPLKCSPPVQFHEHLSENFPQSTEIRSAPYETISTTYPIAHLKANLPDNTFHSSQHGFPQASSSMEMPMQWTSQHYMGPLPSSQQHYKNAGPSSQQHYMSAGPSSQQHSMSSGPSSQQHYMGAGPSSQQHYMGALPTSQQHYMSAGPSSKQHYMGALPSSQQHYAPALPTSQQHYMAPFPRWHSNAHRYSAPQPVVGWEMMPPPVPSQPFRPTSNGLQPKGNTAQPTKRSGININIRVGKCAHDAGITEKFSTCGICCCLLIPVIGCIFCMKSKDVVCAKCDKVIGNASQEKKIAQGKCSHDGGTEEKFSKCGVCCCLLIPIIGCIFCSRNKNLVCVKCDKVVGKVSQEKVENIDEECEKPKAKSKKRRKSVKQKEKLSPDKDKKKLIRKVSHKKKNNMEGEVKKRSNMNVENPG